MKTSTPLFICLIWLGCFITEVQAEPAAWYIWESTLNADRICAQISPGDQWIKRLGPFKNAQCK